MTAQQAIELGNAIAQRHKKQVMELIDRFGASPDQALDGCIVALASEIMVAIQDHRLITDGVK